MTYKITGMNCSACSQRVEREISSVLGVEYCSVNLLTGLARVEGGDDSAIRRAVSNIGYGIEKASLNGTVKSQSCEKNKNKVFQRLIISLFLLIPLMYFSMGYVMWGAPVGDMLDSSPMLIAIIQMIISGVILGVNFRFFVSGFIAVKHGAANMDTLVSLGSGVSYLWSVFITVKIIFQDAESARHLLCDLYFESAAMILALITVGKLLEARAKGKTTSAIEKLLSLAPSETVILSDGKELEIPTSEVKLGDVFVVRPGKNIPVDGRIIEGLTAIDESSLTGESMPVDKNVGDSVYAGTCNVFGYILCEATAVGDDNSLAKIVKLVEDASSTKAPIAKMADRVASFFVPTVILIALITTVVWIFVNNSLGYALTRGIAVLVISCPCALGLATPVAIMVTSGIGASRGVLFKSAAAIEACGRASVIALDKTGTVTKGEPTVTDFYCINTDERSFLSYAYAIENRSEHPLARAVIRFADKYKSDEIFASELTEILGVGVKAVIAEEDCYAVSLKYAIEKFSLSGEDISEARKFADEAKTPLIFIKGKEPIGIIAVADVIREDSAQAVRTLSDMGIKTVMLTGDNSQVANYIAEKVSVDEVIAELRPVDKAEKISKLSEREGVIMVGDGINDAPALALADVGMAIGCGTDIAIESCDVVLVNSKLSDVAFAVKLSRAALRNIRENLFFAFIYNIIGIPLAAGVFIPLFGWELNPMFGAAAMSLSSFSVVMNALRLNYKFKNKKKQKEDLEEDVTMKKTVKVKGMMCPHCEARVKAALEAIAGVESAEVSHKKGRCILNLKENVDNDTVSSAITSIGYTVISIE